MPLDAPSINATVENFEAKINLVPKIYFYFFLQEFKLLKGEKL